MKSNVEIKAKLDFVNIDLQRNMAFVRFTADYNGSTIQCDYKLEITQKYKFEEVQNKFREYARKKILSERNLSELTEMKGKEFNLSINLQ